MEVMEKHSGRSPTTKALPVDRTPLPVTMEVMEKHLRENVARTEDGRHQVQAAGSPYAVQAFRPFDLNLPVVRIDTENHLRGDRALARRRPEAGRRRASGGSGRGRRLPKYLSTTSIVSRGGCRGCSPLGSGSRTRTCRKLPLRHLHRHHGQATRTATPPVYCGLPDAKGADAKTHASRVGSPPW